jgi:hypothetical protein
VTGEVQSTLEFFNEVPQTYFCKKCGKYHKAGECKEADQDGQRASKGDR